MTRRVKAPVYAGLVDAGFSALASFVVGIFAVKVFDPRLLGVYALALSAYLVATIPSRFLLLLPAEVAAVSLDKAVRLRVFWESVRLAVPVIIGSAACVSLWLFVSPRGTPDGVLLALTLGAVAATVFSPIQDHLRQLMHIAGASWTAAGVSAVHLCATLAALGIAWRAGAPSEWIPLGALAFAFMFSSAVGTVWLWRSSGPRLEWPLLDRRDLFRSGRWLLPVGILPSAANFGAAAIVAHLAGLDTLGFAEAARVVGRPVTVVSLGLLAVMGPRSMRFGRDRDIISSRRVSTRFNLLVGSFGVAYLVLAGLELPGNPIPRLLPNAYAIPGLLALTIVANLVNAVALPFRSELMGGRRERSLTKAESLGAATQTAIAFSAGATASYSVPLGSCVAAVVRILAYLPSLHALYKPQEFSNGDKDD